jgi:hypothetical protein
MKFRIGSVDYEPDDLDRQLPIRGRLLREIAGPDRSDYWLAELRRPLSWATEEGRRTVRHLVLKARWLGTAIGPGAKIPVNIYYVTDDRMLDAASFGRAQIAYVAIGMIKVSGAAFLWKKFWNRLRSRPR